METNKIDKDIKEHLANRTIAPSASAWERLSVQLDEQPKKNNKSWFFYVRFAASVLILISIGIYSFSKDVKTGFEMPLVVEEVQDTTKIVKNIQNHFNNAADGRAIVIVTEKGNNKHANKKGKNAIRAGFNTNNPFVKESINAETPIVASFKVDENSIQRTQIQLNANSVLVADLDSINHKKNTSRIKVNADALLYAVMQQPNTTEQKNVSKTIIITREDLLNTIKMELKKSNLKVNPETILAEVERTIHKDAFDNNFLKSLRGRISNIATAIASRNN